MDDWEVTVSHVDYAPGRVGTAHHHAGFVLAYVLEGAVIAKISGQGEEKTYTTGQMFYEQPGATHEVSKNASQTEPAKLLAMIFAKKGATLTRGTRVRGAAARRSPCRRASEAQRAHGRSNRRVEIVKRRTGRSRERLRDASGRRRLRACPASSDPPR